MKNFTRRSKSRCIALPMVTSLYKMLEVDQAKIVPYSRVSARRPIGLVML